MVGLETSETIHRKLDTQEEELVAVVTPLRRGLSAQQRLAVYVAFRAETEGGRSARRREMMT